MSKTNATRIQHHPKAASQFNDIPSIPGDPAAELARVEVEVDKVAAVLASLLSRVNYLKAQINVSRSSFLRVLPSEIIAEIFTLCIEVPSPEDEPGNVDNTIPLKLGAVCNAFRTIAWSTPQLWSKVVLDIKSAWKIAAQAGLLSEWLSRSGHLPLSIWLNSSDEVHWAFAQPDLILKVISIFSSRWKYVDIRLPSSSYQYLPASEEWPQLESLTFKPPGGQGDRTHRIEICKAPNLRSVTLQCLYLRSIKFAWHLLTVLDLESFYVDESLEIFGQAFNLMHLNVRRILGGDDGHTLPSDPIVMSSLISLVLVNDKGTDISAMLSCLTLPALRKLSYSADGTIFAPCLYLTRLLQRSSCPLEFLALKHCPVSYYSFKDLLSNIPSVKELCLEMPDRSASHASRFEVAPLADNILQLLDLSFTRANGRDQLLPNLEVLSYTGLQGFSWPQMMRTVESRTIGISSGGDSAPDPRFTRPVPVKLKEVTLCLTLSPEEVSALTTIEPPSARETGLKWRLKTSIKTEGILSS